MQAETPLFDTWLDRFFASYYDARPVNATFIGVHDRDHLFPDFSERGAADALGEMESLLRESEQWGEEPLSPSQRIDERLATGFLRTQIWEYKSQHFHLANPSTYTGEAVFGVLSMFLSEFAPLEDRIDSARARLSSVPAVLTQLRENVRTAPSHWTRRAIRECRGALAFLTEGIELVPGIEALTGVELRSGEERSASEPLSDAEALAGTELLQSDALRGEIDGAARAFQELHAHLEGELLARPSEVYGCGEEAFGMYLRDAHCVDTPAAEIARYAEDQLEAAAGRLEEGAAEFGGGPPDEVLARLSTIHPTVEGYYPKYGELWDTVRETVEAQRLLTWPEFPIRYVPRPEWARGASPYLYFLFYRSPAASGRPAVHDYLVEPIDAAMVPAEQGRLLAATNDSVIKLNHVIHHGSVGHHVQNWHAFRAESRIGRIAAVDCASRIAMLCGGTMAEGWACYATDLLSEAGLLTPLEQYAENRARTRMCARAVVDVRLHSGEYSIDDAARYYEVSSGMSERAALAEAVKNSMFPGGAVMYLLGRDGIHDLRRDMEVRRGNDFDLCSFHDDLLAHGSIPVSLIRSSMLGTPDAV